MSHHIVLTFLSMVRTAKTDNGMEKTQETFYSNLEGEATRTTNESALRYLLQGLGGDSIDRIFVFASNAVRDPKKAFVSAELDGRKVTHLEYFRERMRKFIPYIDECMPEEAIYPYDEAATMEESLRSVAKMAKRIQEFVRRAEGKEVRLHVDLTGGMRSVNVMMLDVVRLLEYSGVTIGHLLYSNYDSGTKKGTVEELGNIYDLFGLISGAEEFVRFGSAKALKGFYPEHSSSPQLRCLLDAMDHFAEEIKLCHYGQLKEAIVELHDAVRDFDAETSNDVQELLMERLIARIRREYHDLIVLRDLDDLRVIRWCLKHGYMQQALTLYTERVPEYMGEHGLIQQTSVEKEKLEKKVAADTMGRNPWFYLLNECRSEKDRIQKHFNKYCYFIKSEAVLRMRKKTFDMEAWWKEVSTFLAERSLACQDEKRLKEQVRLLNAVHIDPKLLMELDSPELDPIRPILSRLKEDFASLEKGFQRLKRLDVFLQKEATNEDLKQWMPMPFFFDEMIRQYPYGARTHEMILDGIFTPAIEESNFLSIMEKYVRLKDERNHSNHARHDQGVFSSAEDLQKCMEDGLDELEAAIHRLARKD